MEHRYMFFRTGWGCVTGIVCAGVFGVAGLLAVMWLPGPSWVRFAVIAAGGVLLLAPAFLVDRACSRRGRDETSS